MQSPMELDVAPAVAAGMAPSDAAAVSAAIDTHAASSEDQAMPGSPLQSAAQPQSAPGSGGASKSFFALARERAAATLAATQAAGAALAAPSATTEAYMPGCEASQCLSDASSACAPSSTSPPHSSSPSGTKRHIASVEPRCYTQNFRMQAPSPPKSPVRARMESSGGGAGAGGSGGSPLRQSSHVRESPSTPPRGGATGLHGSAPASPTRSPVRLGSASRSAPGAAPAGSPTRRAGPGLPPSPTRTPTRARAPSSPSARARLHGAVSPAVARSPVRPFWFPAGVPASPGTKQAHQSRVRALSSAQPHGFDEDALAELTGSVLGLPRFVAPYVRAQCLLLQEGRAELRQAAAELKRRQRAAQQQRHNAAAANNSATGLFAPQTVSPASVTGTGVPTTQQNQSSSDMSIDSAGGGGQSGAAAAAHLSPPQTTLSPSGQRDRGASTTSTSSSVLTVLSAPSSPDGPVRAPTIHEDPAAEAETHFLTPPCIARAADAAAATGSPTQHADADLDSSRRSVEANLSAELAAAAEDEPSQHGAEGLDHVNDSLASGDVSLGADDEDDEERVLAATFQLYYSAYLEKFRDPVVRLFRVMRGDVHHLLDAATNTIADGARSPQVANDSMTSPQQQAIHSPAQLGADHSVSSPLAPPALHVPSPREGQVTPLSPGVDSSPSPASSPPHSSLYLSRAHFQPLLECILVTHPGLSFLHATPEFQSKYAQTCVARLFYSVCPRAPAAGLSLSELRRSNLLGELRGLEAADDINLSARYFSYQHFYVLYCKFWELDDDHDGYLTLRNLEEYDNGALSAKIVERVAEACRASHGPLAEGEQARDSDDLSDPHSTASQAMARALTAGRSSVEAASVLHYQLPCMSYVLFIPFFLSEIDKTSGSALRYWFSLLDVDQDGVLSLFELDHFFAAQREAIQALSSDTIRWVDIVCQVLDMIKGGESGVREVGTPPRLARGAKAARAEAGDEQERANERAAAARARRRNAAMLDTPSLHAVPALDEHSLAFHHSNVHITRADLARSGLQSYLFNLLFNLPRFLACEARDPHKSRVAHECHERGVSEWQHYAAAMYQALVDNESLQTRAAEQQALKEANAAAAQQGADAMLAHDDELHTHAHSAASQQAQQEAAEAAAAGLEELSQRCDEEELMEDDESGSPSAAERARQQTHSHAGRANHGALLSPTRSALNPRRAMDEEMAGDEDEADGEEPETEHGVDAMHKRAAEAADEHSVAAHQRRAAATAAMSADAREYLQQRFQPSSSEPLSPSSAARARGTAALGLDNVASFAAGPATGGVQVFAARGGTFLVSDAPDSPPGKTSLSPRSAHRSHRPHHVQSHEERAYLRLQRKIHAAELGLDASDQLHARLREEEDEDEDDEDEEHDAHVLARATARRGASSGSTKVTSPSASSRPILIPSSGGGASAGRGGGGGQLQLSPDSDDAEGEGYVPYRLGLQEGVEDEDDETSARDREREREREPCSSVSPPYVAPARPSARAQSSSLLFAPAAALKSMDLQAAPATSGDNGKENAHGHNSANVAAAAAAAAAQPAGFKRQLTFGEPSGSQPRAARQPLSPSRAHVLHAQLQ